VVVGVLIVKNRKVFLTRRGTFRGKPILEFRKWSLPSGFMDRNETLMETAKREVWEETGWKIDKLKLFKIVDNPKRPHDGGRQNVSFVYIANPVSQVAIKSEEVLESEWFDLNSLPSKKEVAFDYYETLILFKKYLKKKFPLPVLE
jgi:ADP-ribose pyrophosphatase YjhB (NUDIX family)